MYILHNYTQNYPLYKLQLVVESLETQVNEPAKQILIKAPKVVNSTNKKTLSLNLGTSVINSPMSPPSLSISFVSTKKG